MKLATTRKTKGIGLISGGLDSMLAAKVLEEQGIDLLLVTFLTPFFSPDAGTDAARSMGIPVRLIDMGVNHLEMLKNPRYGYGKHMNPCIDCHALMLREAGGLMGEEGADFLFTGEVLGQRPMSQRRDSLRSVENLSGYPGRVLRPLSARLLAPTIPETEGLVDRERLLDIQGRSRKRQMALAVRYGIAQYPQPGGGCLLTKEGFVKKLRELLSRYPEAGPRELELLKWGRNFLMPEGAICLIGRNESDNQRLESLAVSGDVLLHVLDYPGPTGLIPASSKAEKAIPLAAGMLLSYSDAPSSARARVQWRHEGRTGILEVENTGRGSFKDYMI